MPEEDVNSRLQPDASDTVFCSFATHSTHLRPDIMPKIQKKMKWGRREGGGHSCPHHMASRVNSALGIISPFEVRASRGDRTLRPARLSGLVKHACTPPSQPTPADPHPQPLVGATIHTAGDCVEWRTQTCTNTKILKYSNMRRAMESLSAVGEERSI